MPKCQTKIFKAKRPQKRPNLTYLALRKAKWQPCKLQVGRLAYIGWIGALDNDPDERLKDNLDEADLVR